MTIKINGIPVRGQLRQTGRTSLDYHSNMSPEWLVELEGGMDGTGAPCAALFVLTEQAAKERAAKGFESDGWIGYWEQVLRHSVLVESASPKDTKSGVVAALIKLGFEQAVAFPPALANVTPAASFTTSEMEFAAYMVADTDFGGCWDDAEQINMHLV